MYICICVYIYIYATVLFLLIAQVFTKGHAVFPGDRFRSVALEVMDLFVTYQIEKSALLYVIHRFKSMSKDF